MLITNFSAGELSENLFGRTDLGQYFQGAARLENFEIIPTGGIEKRGGTRRVLAGLENARVVPFLINREEVYLLFFTHERITAYRVGEWDAPRAVFTNADISTEDNPQTLYKDDEVQTFQHAQNYNIMIMAQKNHPPLEIRRIQENELQLYVIRIEIEVSVETVSGGVDTLEYYEEDLKYKASGYLKSSGNYPGSVTFMNGRLVFASTKANPQRIFASRVDGINNFSTYKKYLTETREYVVVRGTVDEDQPTIVIDVSEGLKFTAQASLESYFIEGPFFPPDTKIVKIVGNVITMSEKSTVRIILTDEERGALEQWRDEASLKNANKIDFGYIGSAYNTNGNPRWGFPNFYLYVGATEVTVAAESGSDLHRVYYTRPFYKQDALAAQADGFPGGEADSSMKNAIVVWLTSLCSSGFVFRTWEGPGRPPTEEIFTNAVGQIIENLRDYMFYSFRGDQYVGPPSETYTRIINDTSDGMDVYLAFYTKKITEDRYPTAEDGFTFELASDRNDQIRWLVQNKHLVAGTETAEYVIPSDTTAVNLKAYLNSFYGSAAIQATSAGDAILFFREGQRGMVEYYIPQADNYFRTNDLLMFARQMLSESEVADYDIATSPYTNIIITRADGTLAALLYDRSLGVFAWSRFSGGGKARGLAVVPGPGGYDDLYLLAERDDEFFLEVYEYGSRAYLDSYTETSAETWAEDQAGYDTAKALISRIDRDAEGRDIYESYSAEEEPPWEKGGEFYIGYPYRAVMRTMPVLANQDMKKQRITGLAFRFKDSYMPEAASIAGGREIKADVITGVKAPFSGVRRIPFPGTWDEDVQAEIRHGKPEPVKILAIRAEVQ